jgi:hypothetical protein
MTVLLNDLEEHAYSVVRFHVLTEMTVKFTVLRDVTSCSLYIITNVSKEPTASIWKVYVRSTRTYVIIYKETRSLCKQYNSVQLLLT